MDEVTPLDHAHLAMQAAPHDDLARLGFYERLADGELFLMLACEPAGEIIDPQVFPVEGAQYVLVFDRQERLAEFAGEIVPYVALSGRAIAAMLKGQGLGLAVNPGLAPSSILIPADAVTWLAETVAVPPTAEHDRPAELSSPHQIPEAVLKALNVKLAMAGGLAQAAWLVSVIYQSGRQGHLLGVVDAVPAAETALSKAVAEALIFSGVEAGEIDVAFFKNQDAICARLAKVGLRFDLPQHSHQAGDPAAPGMDPEKPPRLR